MRSLTTSESATSVSWRSGATRLNALWLLLGIAFAAVVFAVLTYLGVRSRR
jgi:hypothetical protein